MPFNQWLIAVGLTVPFGFAYIMASVLFLGCLGGSYVFGAVSYHRALWPIPDLRALSEALGESTWGSVALWPERTSQ
jgi:hypothetical protein